ncbi:hypothetical protein CBS101457_002956 [Exobasidium rhododendri]|nr:hypothetical protein CBS101457_002956 [Exobasidium rhododendri]
MTKSNSLIAVIVGGSSGIGASCVRRFLRAGCTVVNADLTANTFGGKVSFIQVDVTSDASLSSLVQQVVALHGRIDFAISTAGITGPTVEGHMLQDSDYHAIMRVDLKGAWRVAKAMIIQFRKQEPRVLRDDSHRGPSWKPVLQRGSLTIVSSSLGSEGKSHLAAYCAAKHGVIGLCRALALENAEHDIRINTVSPGLTMTPLLQTPGFDLEMAKKIYLTDQPMNRFAHPDEIAAGIYFTASDGASFMTGSDWGPDGGHHIR